MLSLSTLALSDELFSPRKVITYRSRCLLRLIFTDIAVSRHLVRNI